MDFSHLLNFIRNVNDKKIKKIKNVQNRKLFSLGLEHEITRLNPHDLIFNYSNRILSDEEIEALSHGLKFGLSPKKIDYSQWFLSFEKLFLKLKSCDIFASSKDDLNFFTTSLKTLAFKTFYSFRPWSSVLEKQFLNWLWISVFSLANYETLTAALYKIWLTKAHFIHDIFFNLPQGTVCSRLRQDSLISKPYLILQNMDLNYCMFNFFFISWNSNSLSIPVPKKQSNEVFWFLVKDYLPEIYVRGLIFQKLNSNKRTKNYFAQKIFDFLHRKLA